MSLNELKIDEELLELTKSLIRIKSNYFNEDELIEFVNTWLNDNNLPSEIHEYFDEKVTKFHGKNIIGRIKGQETGKTILLNGHLDTVNICDGWDTDPLVPTIKDGKLFGLGSLDMKSGVAAFLMALKLFKKRNKSFKGEIIYSFVSDEEGPYGLGTNFLIHDGYLKDADVAIVSEPSAGFTETKFPCLCLGARGGYSYKILLTGKAAHAANPDKGISAIVDAAKLITHLKSKRLRIDDKLGSGDICVIGINGGGEACSVAEKCEIQIFQHIVTGEDKESILEEIKDAVDKVNIESTCTVLFREAPTPNSEGFLPYVVEENNYYVEAFKETINQAFDEELNIRYFQSIGDFNYLGSRLNIPTLVFGPNGDNYHSSNEYVEIEDIQKTCKAVLMYMEKLML